MTSSHLVPPRPDLVPDEVRVMCCEVRHLVRSRGPRRGALRDEVDLGMTGQDQKIVDHGDLVPTRTHP